MKTVKILEKEDIRPGLKIQNYFNNEIYEIENVAVPLYGDRFTKENSFAIVKGGYGLSCLRYIPYTELLEITELGIPRFEPVVE
jgi:hypothetical protein